MDEKLLEFRRKKAREKFKEDLQNYGERSLNKIRDLKKGTFNIFRRRTMPTETVSLEEEDEEVESEEEDTVNPFNVFKIISIGLLWIICYMFFIYIGFGAVYFCITALFFVYYNTRTRKRQRNEISAYSVFNYNCENIDGTFTAEQFDKQLRSGMI